MFSPPILLLKSGTALGGGRKGGFSGCCDDVRRQFSNDLLMVCTPAAQFLCRLLNFSLRLLEVALLREGIWVGI